MGILVLYLSLILAIAAGLGRQIAVFGRIEKGLWLFSNWHWLRIVLTVASITLAVLAYINAPPELGWGVLPIVAFLNGFAYFFDMPFFFPEVKQLKRIPGNRAEIDSNTEVIGVTLGQTSVAYPIDAIVMPRHIVHDTIEGTAVLVSYCALCRSALAFKAEMESQKLYFQVAGVWRRNMIVVDEPTKSIWQQATGECIYGKNKGKQLELLSGENTIWQSWQKKHPHSEYASEFIEARRGLMSREKMLAALKAVSLKVGVPGVNDLRGLPKRETVFGITVNGSSKAYPISKLATGMRFSDRIGNQEIVLEYDSEARYLSASEKATGKPILVEKHWWLGWKEFHPNTEIWENVGDKLG